MLSKLKLLRQQFPPFPLGHNSTTSLICNKIFLMLKVNYSLVLISFYYSWCTLNNSPFFPFLSSEVLSLSQLHSQLQVQKLNAFRYCKSSFKSEETAVTFRYSQYFNLSLLGIRWCLGLRGMFQTGKKIPDIHFFRLRTQQVAYSAFSVLTSFQIHIQLHANMLSIVSPLKNLSINHSQISLIHSK